MMRPTRMLRENESWRDNGISYLKYLNVCTDSLHNCVKESQKAKYEKFAVQGGFYAQKFNAGTSLFEPAAIDGVPAKVKDYGLAAASDNKASQ